MFNWLKRGKPVEITKASKTGAVIFAGQKAAKWSKREFAAFSDEGYKRNVIVFQAIDKTAKACASIPFFVRGKNGKEKEDSAFLQLLNNPNPMQSGNELIRDYIGFRQISGNAYIERTMYGGAPQELYILRSDRVTIQPGPRNMPSAYKYKVGQNEAVFTCPNNPLRCDIRHIKTFNPLDDWYGMSPIEAAAYSVDTHNEASKSVMALLQNSMRPSGVVTTGGDSDLSDEAYNRLKADIEEKYTGAQNSGKPLLLERATWQQMGMSPSDADLLNTKYSSARDISLALGVPPIMLSIQGDSTYSNYKEARLRFTKN
jgi:HK97 family phage portal protein